MREPYARCLVVTGLVLLGACKDRESRPPPKPAAATTVGSAASPPREPTISGEAVKHVYTSRWSDFATVKTYGFIGWKAVVTGGDQDCRVSRRGPPIRERSWFVPAHARVPLFVIYKVHPEDVDQVRLEPEWTFACGPDRPKRWGPVDRVTLGTPKPDAAYGAVHVPITLRGDSAERCTVVVYVAALDRDGFPLDTSTARIAIDGGATINGRVQRSTDSSGVLEDYKDAIAGFAAYVGRVDCRSR